MRYRRDALADKHWHKIVLHDRDPDVAKSFLRKNIHSDYMINGGAHWMVIWIDNDQDLILTTIGLAVTADDYRGYGDWSKKKVWSAASNRILPNK